jgi:hypothetical protein
MLLNKKDKDSITSLIDVMKRDRIIKKKKESKNNNIRLLVT